MIEHPTNLYLYKAKLINVYDGDTITVDIDLGFGIVQRNVHIRLLGINAPELKGASKELGKQSRDFLISLLTDNNIYIETVKDKTEKYGRMLGVVYVHSERGLENINQKLVENSFAKEYMTGE